MEDSLITCERCGRDAKILSGYLTAVCKKGHRTQVVFCKVCDDYRNCYAKSFKIKRYGRVLIVIRRACKCCNTPELLEGEEL